MQPLATAELMRLYDSVAIQKFSIPGIVLMENAGRAFVDLLEKAAGTIAGKSIVIFCGKGNNGGDGFVIARHCANRGATVHVGLCGKKSEVKGDARTNLDIVVKTVRANASNVTFQEILSAKACSQFNHCDVIVDAIFGTGFSGSVTARHKSIIEWINSQRAFVAAADIPSGVNAANGIVENVAVKADLTITMGLGKIGHYVGAGREHSGRVEIADISIPKFLYDRSPCETSRVEMSDVKRFLTRRPLVAHKYSVGKVFVLSGSRMFCGAPVLTSLAAMRTGAGLAILGVPQSVHAAVAMRLTEVIVRPLEETADGTVSLAALPEIQHEIARADVVALGPGLSLNEETQEVVCEIVRSCAKPMIIDADALTALASNVRVVKGRKYPTILTPHVGELHRLVKMASSEIESHRVEVARQSARELNCTAVLKGSPTVTATQHGQAFLNTTGNPGMATGGSGDVLTGMLASLVAQRIAPEAAAYSGAYLHGLAGDSAAKKLGERGLMAMDIVQQIPTAIRLVENA